MFEEMEASIQDEIASLMYHVAIVQKEEEQLQDRLQNAQASHGDEVSSAEARKSAPKNPDGSKVGRNDPCPCGSGKKYKNCCGRKK